MSGSVDQPRSSWVVEREGERMTETSRSAPGGFTPLPRRRLRRGGGFLLLCVALLACGQQRPTTAAGNVQLEAENGTVLPLAPQDIAEPRTGGKIIRDQDASGGQAVLLSSFNDAVRFKLPGNFAPGRYTVKVQGRGEFYQGWPTVALENDRRCRVMSTTTLDTKGYAPRGFGEFDLRPNQEMFVSFLNDRYGGPGQDRNAVVDSLLIEPVGTTPTPPRAPPASFVYQFGSSKDDYARDVAVDAGGNSYVVGNTSGAFPCQTQTSDRDAFVQKVDPYGTEVWTRQFGSVPSPNSSPTSFLAVLSQVAVDVGGNVYVAGVVQGSSNLPGQTPPELDDVFLRKYTPDGTEVWTRQFGTAGSDAPLGLGVDATGNVYLVGNAAGLLPGQEGYTGSSSPYSSVPFVRKYSPGGDVLWTRQFAALLGGDFPGSWVGGAAVDPAGNVYVAGSTAGAFPGQTQVGDPESGNAFVRKYSAGGVALWTRQLGTEPTPPDPDRRVYYNTAGVGIGVDAAGNSYLAGNVSNNLEEYGGALLVGPNRAGSGSQFLSKYGPDGTPLWIRQFGSSGGFLAQTAQTVGVAADAAGNAFVAGDTPVGLGDLFVTKYGPQGALLATRQLGTAERDGTGGLAVGTKGSVYLAGYTSGVFPRQKRLGWIDAFLIKLTP